MSDTNQNRKSQVESKSPKGEKKEDASFAKFFLNFIIYFGLGYLILTALGFGK